MPSTNPSSSSSAGVDISDLAAAAPVSGHAAYRVTSSLLTQDAVDALCTKHGVPTAYIARPAGDRRAFTPPPERGVCLYAHALEAGVRVPLHSFFSKVLTHFNLAPGQLVHSGWRVLVGFVVFCHDAGVKPSTTVFRYFFALVKHKSRCWYGFREKHDNRALFTGYYSKSDEVWKGRFFLLTSPEPWPCPVLWGEPPLKYQYSYSVPDPELTSQQKKTVAKLLQAHGTAVDLRTYLSDTKLAAVFSSNLSSPPPGPALHSTGAKGMDSSAAKVKPEPEGDTPTLSLKKGKHEDATISKDGLCRSGCSASASGLGAPPGFDPKAQRSPVSYDLPSPSVEGMDLAKVKPEPDGDAPTLSPKKRKHEGTATAKDGLCCSDETTLHAAHGRSASASGLGAPPGFGPKPHQSPAPDTHDADSADLEAAKKLLECITTPSREREFAAARPSDVVASSYLAMLQAANYASFSFGYALELETKLAARDKENAALRVQLESAKTELAAAKRAGEAEVEKAKTTAVQRCLESQEHTRKT